MAQVDIYHLKFWINKVINDPELLAQNGKTFCNIFVQRVCRGLGYDKFDGMTANEIYDYCNSNWTISTVPDAIAGAIIGDIVIAACREAKHGHVAIVWPDKPLVYSGKWKMEVPRVASVGKITGVMGANYAFLDPPNYFRSMRVTQ